MHTLLLLIISALSIALVTPLPLHTTNTQRLPDQPGPASDNTDYTDTVTAVVQKHKYIPDIAAPILRLCGRGSGFGLWF